MDTLVAANGCDSAVTTNLTVRGAISSAQILTICNGESITIEGNVYNTTGIFMDTLVAANGCDSIVTTDLTVNTPVNIGTTVDLDTITANQTGATYQWIDCNGNAPIAGATNQSYTVTFTGDYAVIVTDNSCSDTSMCVNVMILDVNKLDASTIQLYPNPVENLLTVDLKQLTGAINVSVVGVDGKAIYNKLIFKNGPLIINTEKWNSGIYFVKIKNDKQNAFFKLIKA